MCLFLLTAVIFGFCVKQFSEPDIWWHLRYAQDLIQSHTFSPVDTFTFTAAGSPRPNYEWLSEVPYYFGYRAAGLHGILTVYFCVLVLIYAGVYYLSCTAGADCKDATPATLLGIFLGVVSIGPRTLLFGWLCMVALLFVLDRFRRSGKGIWMLPPLFALWINLHPLWAFGMVVLCLTIASGLVEGNWGLIEAAKWERAALRKLLTAFVISIAALFLNPFGYRLVLYPFDFLFRQQSNTQFVEEWQGVDFSTGNGKLALFVLLGLVALNLLVRRRWRLDEALLMAFALWAALSHTRFLFLAGLIFPPILAPRIHLFPPYEPELDKPVLNGIIMVGVVLVLWHFFPSNAELQKKVEEDYPKAALEYMQREQMYGRLYNPYSWGGYMEWTAPEFKPFIDSRADIFVYNGVLDEVRKVNGLEDPFGVLDKYRIDYVLVQRQRPLAYVLNHSTDWRAVYSDRLAQVFAREAPANKAQVTPIRAGSPGEGSCCQP